MGMIIGKALTLLVWAAIALNWLQPFQNADLSTALNYTGLGLAVAHVIELAIFSARIRATAKPLANALQTLIFGYAHVAFMDK